MIHRYHNNLTQTYTTIKSDQIKKMAKSVISYATFLVLFFCFLLVFPAYEMQMVEAQGKPKLCYKMLKGWNGPCSYCSPKCKSYGYKYGVCKKQYYGHSWKYACYCYFYCKH